MPAAPKPSQEKKFAEQAGSKTKAAKAIASKKETIRARPKQPKEKSTNGRQHAIPKRGKCFAWLEEIKAAGGITRLALIEGCVVHGLKATMHGEMGNYCRQLSLLKD